MKDCRSTDQEPELWWWRRNRKQLSKNIEETNTIIDIDMLFSFVHIFFTWFPPSFFDLGLIGVLQ